MSIRCWLCSRPKGEGHSKRCSVTKFGVPERYIEDDGTHTVRTALDEMNIWHARAKEAEAENTALREALERIANEDLPGLPSFGERGPVVAAFARTALESMEPK